MSGNAVNTMFAHESRAGDDNIFVRSIVEGYSFLTWGIVEKYEEGRVDVACGSLHFTDVEVLVIGINGWGIKPVLAKDDKVLLLTTQAPVPDIAEYEASGTMPPYDLSGMKAIPVTTQDTAQLITISADGIEITGDNKLTVNADGISVEDKNKNKIVTAAAGVTITDTKGNTFVMKEKEVSMTVKNGSTIVATDSSVKINNKLEIK